jgi:hypothetical protein
MLLGQDPLPLLRLNLPSLLYSWRVLHHKMVGMSHHMDPLKRSLTLCSSVKTITSFSETDVQHHTINSICSPCYRCFPLHLTHTSHFVQMLFSTVIKIIRKYLIHRSVTFLRNWWQYRKYLLFMVPKNCILRSTISCNPSVRHSPTG